MNADGLAPGAVPISGVQTSSRRAGEASVLNDVGPERSASGAARSVRQRGMPGAKGHANVCLNHGPTFDQTDGELCSRRQLLRQLKIEKQRTDRTKSPLSVLVFTLDPLWSKDHLAFWRLLQLLSQSKRATDILGYLSDQKVALLLPHTDAGGAQALVAIVRERAGELVSAAASATYPDEIFDSLLRDTPGGGDSTELLFQVPAENPPYIEGMLKRSIDVVGSLLALILFSPVMLVAAIAIKATSPGPVIFRQARLGLRGRSFQFYKFRSMVANSDDRAHREYVANLIEGNLDVINKGDADRPLYKMKDDPRVTKVGRFIRKTSIDELPQLFNVLKGDMSLVGPRPPLPYEAEKYESWHLRRILEIRPGITGPWQVYGRSSTSFDQMVRLDLGYIRGCSLWLDIKLLLATVWVLLGHRGAA